jgi:hypothetical protein
LLELHRVHSHRDGGSGQPRLKLDGRREETPYKRLDLTQCFPQVKNSGTGEIASSEGEQLPSEGGGTLDRTLGFVEIGDVGGPVVQPWTEEVEVALNHGEEVVEIMGDPPCQTAQRL